MKRTHLLNFRKYLQVMDHRSDVLRERLHQQLDDPSVPKPQSLWQHYKGDIYKVEYVGIRESTEELEICYRAVENPLICFWIRPLSEWNQKVNYNGLEMNRFSHIQH